MLIKQEHLVSLRKRYFFVAQRFLLLLYVAAWVQDLIFESLAHYLLLLLMGILNLLKLIIKCWLKVTDQAKIVILVHIYRINY